MIPIEDRLIEYNDPQIKAGLIIIIVEKKTASFQV